MKDLPKFSLGLTAALGAVWGLSEAALGIGLRSCAATFSGSLMTATALGFLAAGWAVSRRAAGIGLMVVVASLFKLFDALLLSLPLTSGAVANPIFAFFTQGAFLWLLLSVVKSSWHHKLSSQALLGAAAALLAVAVFPLVGFATGVPACTAAGTSIPLSLYYGPLALIAAALTVPLGLRGGSRLAAFWARLESSPGPLGRRVITPATLIVCLVLAAALRLI